MKNLIKKILKEEGDKPLRPSLRSPYKFTEGGYLVKCDKNEGTIHLYDDEFNRLKKLNDNIKELYENQMEYLRLSRLHNKGVIQHAVAKIKGE